MWEVCPPSLPPSILYAVVVIVVLLLLLLCADNYVHRLVQSKGDGKLVEVGSREGQPLHSDEKMDSLQLEVCEFLCSQTIVAAPVLSSIPIC